MEPVIPTHLRVKIEQGFGSLAALRSLMFQTAMSIHGSGWVWLVVGPSSELRVLATYNSGSPFNIRARQIQDPNTSLNLDSVGNYNVQGLAMNRKHEYRILPVLALNCWEHAYLPDYGVNGKQQYLKNWWAAVNWQRVDEATGRRAVGRITR
jgi:Fe-Mn family superoxide dismutase